MAKQKRGKGRPPIEMTDEEIIVVICETEGTVRSFANHLSISWPTAKKLINQSQDTRDAFDARGEEGLDEAVETIMSKIRSKDERISFEAAKFLLLTKGKKRGFSYQHDIKADHNFTNLPDLSDLTFDQIKELAFGGQNPSE